MLPRRRARSLQLQAVRSRPLLSISKSASALRRVQCPLPPRRLQQLRAPLPAHPAPSRLPIRPCSAQCYVQHARRAAHGFGKDIHCRSPTPPLALNLKPRFCFDSPLPAVAMHNFLLWHPTSCVIFLAPTRPLAAQQHAACAQIIPLPPPPLTLTLTGNSCPKSKRPQAATPLHPDAFAASFQ
jgi:hypothetical protein